MFDNVNAILFATNLSDSCRQAFDLAAAMATRFQATLVMMHVMEKMPDYVEGRLRGLLGNEQWEAMQNSQEKNAQEFLIGKKSSNRMVKEALAHFCSQAGIDDDACGYHSREIVISDGDVVEDILKHAEEYNCDMIIMGARDGFLSKNTIGNTIKSVMRRSGIPVMMVPPTEETS
jgi:nucleotide-binding universal stress UspA family protein